MTKLGKNQQYRKVFSKEKVGSIFFGVFNFSFLL